MKPSIVIVSLVGITLVAGTIVRFAGKKASPTSPPVGESGSSAVIAQDFPAAFPTEKAPSTSPSGAEEAVQDSVHILAATEPVSDTAADIAPHPTPFQLAIDTLVLPQASFQQKHEAWMQLLAAGQLDQAIEALKQGAAENPMRAAYPAALGQAQLYKAGEVAWNGGTISEMGILGMQADQSFDAALKLDPANWEAQFFKASAMSHWPLELNKGEEVIQRLSRLIDQQDATLPQPEFAQTYVLLGDQYQRMGQPDHAATTWLIGSQKFPGHPELQDKIRGN